MMSLGSYEMIKSVLNYIQWLLVDKRINGVSSVASVGFAEVYTIFSLTNPYLL